MGNSALLSAAYHGDGLRQPAQSAQRYRSRASAPAPASPPAAATSHVALVRLLLARGADPDARGGRPLVFASSRGSPLTVAALAGAGADVHVQDDEPVRAAAERGHAEVLRLLLLRFGAHASALEESALQGAARGGHLPCVRLLLEAGANAAAEGGRRALVAAARAGWVDVVAELVAAGADPADPEFVACAARSATLRRMLGMPPPNCLLNSV
ncbi:ankyrin repeat-containing domain protein [Kickxella alabastrina]|uniref:ankyrin repeat-containing domain protein n=1 Tax=Kickxella alabastrina TaxID=61397 RepID=UPI00221EA7A2|nr:ankyrin repeat-containing domain protein [Kickxella alabastrina]KAI7833900.1 ankyrin repeat-containing domain protein [Kickxella alabastrina]